MEEKEQNIRGTECGGRRSRRAIMRVKITWRKCSEGEKGSAERRIKECRNKGQEREKRGQKIRISRREKEQR